MFFVCEAVLRFGILLSEYVILVVSLVSVSTNYRSFTISHVRVDCIKETCFLLHLTDRHVVYTVLQIFTMTMHFYFGWQPMDVISLTEIIKYLSFFFIFAYFEHIKWGEPKADYAILQCNSYSVTSQEQFDRFSKQIT